MSICDVLPEDRKMGCKVIVARETAKDLANNGVMAGVLGIPIAAASGLFGFLIAPQFAVPAIVLSETVMIGVGMRDEMRPNNVKEREERIKKLLQIK